jgi:hypothetical protein
MGTQRLLRAALTLALVVGGAVSPLGADPGYPLWLRYGQVADAVRLRCPVDMIHSYYPEITGIPPHARKGPS